MAPVIRAQMARTKPGTMPTASTTTKHPSSLGMRSSTAPPALGSTGPHLAGAFVEPADAGTPADAIPVPSTVNHDVGPLAAVQGNLRSEMFNDQKCSTTKDISLVVLSSKSVDGRFSRPLKCHVAALSGLAGIDADSAGISSIWLSGTHLMVSNQVKVEC